MEQNYSPQGQPSPSGAKPFWLIVLLVLVIALIGVLFWQRNIANQMADSLQMQIIALQSQALQKASQQAGQAVSCVQEGGLVLSNQKCCASLSQIGRLFLGNDGQCRQASSVAGINNPEAIGICSKCGDGYCDNRKLDGENQCNCPRDCTLLDVTANWKNYQSVGMGFSMKYPEYWVSNPEINESGGKRVSFSEGAAWRTEYKLSYEQDIAIVKGASYYEGTRKLNCNDWLLNYEERKQITLSGQIALYGTAFDPGHSDKPPTKIYLVCQDSTNTQIYFTVYGYSDSHESEYLKILNGILNSFIIQK